MATQRKIFGRIPTYRGDWSEGVLVKEKFRFTYKGSEFQALMDGLTTPPLNENDELNDGWIVISNGTDAYKAGEKLAYITEVDDNPEYIRAYIDKDGHFLMGIKPDGNIEWAKGIPSPIQVEITKTKDVIESLCYFSENAEYIQVCLDNNYRVLYGVDKSGNVIIPKVKSPIINELIEKTSKSLKESVLRVLVASSEAPQNIKDAADYVCTGINDEVIITQALMSHPNVEVILSEGTFYVDKFYKRSVAGTSENNYVAICCGWYGENVAWDVKLRGRGNKTSNRTRILLRESAFEGLPDDAEPSIIGSYKHKQWCGLWCSDFYIEFPNNLHRCVGINLQWLGHGNLERLSIGWDGHNQLQHHLPVEGCVGIRSYHGSDSGTAQVFQNVYVGGMYEAFQIGSDHMTLIDCGGRYNYYCFTFGNYDWWSGANDHPVVLINCMDEASYKLPLFKACGAYGVPVTEDNLPRQCVEFIGCNLESSQMLEGHWQEPAEEEIPGSFCGRIEFTNGGVGGNTIIKGFWKPGHGIGFETRNMTHRKIGNTAERLSYTGPYDNADRPSYGETYFDTDLNKMLIYNGNRWVDFMGNNI